MGAVCRHFGSFSLVGFTFYTWQTVRAPERTRRIWDLFGSVNALFTGLAFVGLLYTIMQQQEQLNTMQRDILADHERRRLDATMQAIDTLHPRLKAFSHFLDGLTGHRQNIKAEHIDRLREDAALRSSIQEHLEQLETLALAINIGVYDDKVVFRLTGPFLPNLWARCEPYIRDFRHEWPTVCVEFEDLCKRYNDLAKSQYAIVSTSYLPKS
jgi:hypothetical protein